MNVSDIELQLDGAVEEASLLQEYAEYLETAANSNNSEYKILVLDDNMKMWVSIGAATKEKNNNMPQQIKDNLLKLSKYVEQVTLSKGADMTSDYFRSLASINRQISEGLMESVNSNMAQQEAYYMAKCGLDLSQAYKAKDDKAFVAALDANQKLWVMIKTLMKTGKTKLPQETRNNLIKLADYVAGNTIKIGQSLGNVNKDLLTSLVNIDRHISEGLIGHR